MPVCDPTRTSSLCWRELTGTDWMMQIAGDIMREALAALVLLRHVVQVQDDATALKILQPIEYIRRECRSSR